MPKVRVVQILEATIGGTKKHVLQILKSLPKDRYDLSFLCSTLRDPSFEKEIEALRASGVRVAVIPMRRAISPWADVRALLALSAHMRENRCDIAHAHSSKAGALGRIAARLAGVPRIVYSPHAFAFEFQVAPAARWLYRAVERFCARFGDAIVAVSEHERRLAIGLRVLPPHRIFTIENSLDEEDLRPSRSRSRVRKELGLDHEQILVGTVGRLTKQKGLPFLLEAAARLLGEFPDMRFAVAGDGEDLLALERKLIDLRVGRKVWLLGHREDARDLCAAMDIFVLPSLWEGRPYALLEAMAAERAVVASRIGGMDEVIEDGVNGILVPPADAAALADAIAKLAKSAALRRRLGRAARKTVLARYRLPDAIAKLDALYTRLLSETTVTQWGTDLSDANGLQSEERERNP